MILKEIKRFYVLYWLVECFCPAELWKYVTEFWPFFDDCMIWRDCVNVFFFSFKFLWSVEAAVSTVVVRHVNRCVAKYSFLRLVPKEEVRVYFFLPFLFFTHTHTYTHPILCDPLFSFCSVISSEQRVHSCQSSHRVWLLFVLTLVLFFFWSDLQKKMMITLCCAIIGIVGFSYLYSFFS